MSSLKKLQALRSCMKDSKLVPTPLNAYIIPTKDAHQCEGEFSFLAECDKRRQFISDFTGAVGTAVVTPDLALLWSEGQYYDQALDELDDNWTLLKLGAPGVPNVIKWLGKELPSGSQVGFDPEITNELVFKQYSEVLECAGIGFVPVPRNLVDVVWGEDRPARPCNQLRILTLEYSGCSWQDKVSDVQGKMKDAGASVVVVTELDEIAWLFNVRGSDIPCHPVFFAYAIVSSQNVRLYIDEGHLTPQVKEHLCVGQEGGVEIFPYEDVPSHLSQLVRSVEGKVWLSGRGSYTLCSLVPKEKRKDALSPLQLMKAVKNETEIRGMKNAHLRDSAALFEFFYWLENEMANGDLELNELTAAEKLEKLRREMSHYIGLSFPTISASGPSAANYNHVPHHSTARPLSRQELYLCDSGAHYMDGTTDMTRTVTFGTPLEKEMEYFTLVLKSVIAMCKVVFPNKTMGSRVDAFARLPLWMAGLDFNHLTGHGVGCFLNVLEGPQCIEPTTEVYAKPLQAGMFVSNEPGCYENGKFGVRLENIVLVVPAETKYGCDYIKMEPISWIPFQKKMMKLSLLTVEEIAWLNDYHSQCLNKVGDFLRNSNKTEVLKWLERETQPI